jgi:hypothetical protein
METTRGPGKPGEKLVADEIQAMMAGIITAAENVDVEKMYCFLTREPGGLFFINNKYYNLDQLIALFRDTYGKLRSQRLLVSHSEVIPLGPDAAMWIGHGEGRTESQIGGVSMTYSFTETWVWQKINGRWVVTHYHESSG